MSSADLTSRFWTRPTAIWAALLLFTASVGMVFRSVYDSITSIVALPAAVVAAGFGLYCALVVAVVFGGLMRPEHPKVPGFALVAVPLTAVALVAALTLLTPDSLDARADRDDALDIAVRELMAGRNPWGVATPLGDDHLPSPLLGGILLAAPIVLALGSSALQGALWLGIAVTLALRVLGARLTTVGVILLLASPIMLNELAFQSDLWVNALILAIAAIWAWRSAEGLAFWPLAGADALFGVALADRFVLAIVAVPTVALLWRTAGRRTALAWGGGALLLAGALTVIPWIAYPGSIEQTLRNVGKANSEAVPYASVILVLAILIVTVSLTVRATSPARHFWAAAAALAVLPAFEVVTTSVERGTLTVNGYTQVAYSAAFLVFGIAGLILPDAPVRSRTARPPDPAVRAE